MIFLQYLQFVLILKLTTLQSTHLAQRYVLREDHYNSSPFPQAPLAFQCYTQKNEVTLKTELREPEDEATVTVRTYACMCDIVCLHE